MNHLIDYLESFDFLTDESGNVNYNDNDYDSKDDNNDNNSSNYKMEIGKYI